MTRTALTPDRAVYPGDLCYHDDRMAAVITEMESSKVYISYLDKPPIFNTESKSEENPDIHLVDKTSVFDLTNEEKQSLHLYATRGK